MIRHSSRKDMRMHISLPDDPSQRLEENVSACSGQVGVICAHRCQTTSKHPVTFRERKRDFFYLYAKSNLGRKIPQSVLQWTLKRRWRDETWRWWSIPAVYVFVRREGIPTGSNYLRYGKQGCTQCCLSGYITLTRYFTVLPADFNLFPFQRQKSSTSTAVNLLIQCIDPLYSGVINFSRTETHLISKIEHIYVLKETVSPLMYFTHLPSDI